jgi:hypothetical protein
MPRVAVAMTAQREGWLASPEPAKRFTPLHCTLHVASIFATAARDPHTTFPASEAVYIR